MTRRILAIMTMAAVGVSGMIPAQAQEPPPEVPEEVQIEDPEGDANYLNPQGGPGGGDNGTPVSLSVSDLLSVWFTNDKKTIAVHIQTAAMPPSVNSSYLYRVTTNPGDDEDGCLEFEAIIEGPTMAGDSFARLDDECADDFEPIEAELMIAEGPDETGIITITLPRDSHEALGKGQTIASPWAETRNNTGAADGPRLIFPIVDNTEIGDDYAIQEPKKKKKKKRR